MLLAVDDHGLLAGRAGSAGQQMEGVKQEDCESDPDNSGLKWLKVQQQQQNKTIRFVFIQGFLWCFCLSGRSQFPGLCCSLSVAPALVILIWLIFFSDLPHSSPPGPLEEMDIGHVLALCQPGGGAAWQAVGFTPQQRRKYKNNSKRKAHTVDILDSKTHTCTEECPLGAREKLKKHLRDTMIFVQNQQSIKRAKKKKEEIFWSRFLHFFY